MDDPTPEFDQDQPDVCQNCGSRDVQHRSCLRREDQTDGVLLLLCDDCHRKRFGS